ncbi:DUF11 domain-containing protein, partial [Winogradskyella litoriviva]
MKISTRFSLTKNIINYFFVNSPLEKLFLLRLQTIVLVGFCSSFLLINAQENVTTVYGDQGGFFESTTSSVVTATDSNNLLGFVANGITYSTGVDDSLLTLNGISFTPTNFRAFPIPGVINYSNPELLGVAYNWGGVNQTNAPVDYINSFSPIVPTNFVRDGSNGLEMSTNFFNIDSQDIAYDDITVISTAAISDNIPDIIVNQTGEPGGSDTFRFVDNLGNTVGNIVVVDFSSTPVVAGVDWTIYNVDPNTGNVVGTFAINSYRDFRVLAFLLSDFGITAGNSAQIVKFIHTTSGNTDIAFTAYNSNSLGFNTSIDLSIDANIESSTSICTSSSINIITTVTNNSANYANDFEIEAPLPAGLTYANSTAVFSSGTGTATYNSADNKWVIFGLPAGESVTLTVQTSVSSIALPLIYSAEITNLTQTDSNERNNSISISENDNDCDGVNDFTDLDDDNDGILDIDELECSTGFVLLGQTFNNNSNNPVLVNDIYGYNGVDVDASFELVGSASWNGGVSDNSAAGVSGSFVNTQPNNTDFTNGDVAVYKYTFSQPVYNVNFKFGGLDNADRVDFIGLNGIYNVPVSITDINLGANVTINGQSAISAAGGANAPSNSIAVAINGPVTEIIITVGKNNGNAGDVTMQFYELTYCIGLDTDGDTVSDYLDLDSDNDGIYDVDEVGGTDANNDGIADGTPDLNGVPSSASGGITPIDTLSDGIYDFQNTDSDGDGCSDANEAYGDANASGSDDGQYGEPDPASVNLANGLVTELGIDYSNGTNAQVVDGDFTLSVCYIDPCDALASGNLDSDGDGISDICDDDDDNDGILDTV